MRIETKNVYITDDGLEFENKYAAEEHEREMLSYEILKKESVMIGMYEVRKINNKKELDAFVYRDDVDVFNHIPDDVTYPIKIAAYPDCYNGYFIYELLENVIKKEQQLCELLRKEL